MEQYISKSAVLAEIDKVMVEEMKFYETACKEGDEEVSSSPMVYTRLQILRSCIDTLEVKEVDLNNEYVEEVYSHIDSIKDTADRMTSGNFMHNRAAIKFSANTIAKVLELIGLKAQKGEKL